MRPPYHGAGAGNAGAQDGEALAEAFLREERERIASGEVAALGWQLVLR